MATYILKRKIFNVIAAAAKTGGDLLSKAGGGNKMMGAMTVGGIGMTAISGKSQRKEQEAQNQQALQEQKNTLNQLNDIAKS